MTPKRAFRLLILAWIAVTIGSAIVIFYPGSVREDWQPILEWSGSGSVFESSADGEDDASSNQGTLKEPAILLLVAVVLMGLLIYIWLGLFFFWRFARAANLILTVAYLACLPWLGLTVLLPLETLFSELSVLLEGAVIALSYSVPIRHLFKGTPPPMPATT